MKNVTWGILFIVSAAAIVLNVCGVNFGLPESVSLWKIILGAALLIFAIDQLARKNISAVFFPLAIIVLIFENEIAIYLLGKENGEIASTWVFLLVALLLTIGTSLIFNGFSDDVKVKKDGAEYVYKGNGERKYFKEFCGNGVYYIDCASAVCRDIDVNMGKADVYFVNTKLYNGQGKINVDNNMGKVIFHVPEDWVVDCSVKNTLASVEMRESKQFGTNPKHIYINGKNNLGKIEFVDAVEEDCGDFDDDEDDFVG